jgi:inorganic pyrophosphatase
MGRSSISGATMILSIALMACTAVLPRSRAEHPAQDNYLTGYAALAEDGMVNVVVEVPAGANARWKVSESGASIDREHEDGKTRVIQYLPYPGNYGMVPRTLLPRELGGDGDPLDVILLGPALDRGAVVRARPIGLLRLVDDGDRDDKVLAVRGSGPLSEVTDIRSLDERYSGALAIIETWFTNYKGPGRLESRGIGGAEEAIAAIREASQYFEGATQRSQQTALPDPDHE